MNRFIDTPMDRMYRPILFPALVLIAVLGFSPSSVFAAKVNSSPSSATIQEGSGSQLFSITLDEPIITEGETPGFVQLNISSDDARLSLSTSSIYFTNSQWAETRSLTVSATNDGIQNLDNNAVITISVTSNSEYYSGYVATIPVTIVDPGVSSGQSGTPGTFRGGYFSGGGSVIFGCRDTLASNYDRFTQHKASLCVYGNEKVGTSVNATFRASVGTTTDSSIKNITRDLSRGMRGVDVATLQKFLIAQNMGPYAKALSSLANPATGYFGKLTQDALLEWQLSVGVPTTGIFDQYSRAAVK